MSHHDTADNRVARNADRLAHHHRRYKADPEYRAQRRTYERRRRQYVRITKLVLPGLSEVGMTAEEITELLKSLRHDIITLGRLDNK